MMPEPPRTIESVFSAVARAGFVLRGAFRLAESERTGPLLDVHAIALVGVAGRRGFEAFAESPEARDGRDDPLDRFSRRVIDKLAEAFGAVPLYPFGGPRHWPFQRWAQRAEPVHPSPIGLLVHPVYGLWHSFRGALGLREALDLPEAPRPPSPCVSCLEKPCLGACPVQAFAPAGYAVAVCAAHLRSAAGSNCLERGCLARRACPVGADHAQEAAQASFAMRAFLRSLGA